MNRTVAPLLSAQLPSTSNCSAAHDLPWTTLAAGPQKVKSERQWPRQRLKLSGMAADARGRPHRLRPGPVGLGRLEALRREHYGLPLTTAGGVRSLVHTLDLVDVEFPSIRRVVDQIVAWAAE